MEVTVNGDRYQLDRPEPTVADLVEQLGLGGRPVAVELNRDVIPRRRHHDTRLSEGDAVEVVSLVGGG